MTEIEFIGKTLLLTGGKEKVVVIGDLHLGYEEGLREYGVKIPLDIYTSTMDELKTVFDRVGKVNKVVLLGDVKHAMGRIMRDEWKEIGGLLDYLATVCREIIIVKGNHDIFTNIVTEKKDVVVRDFYLWKDTAFVHGDRDFDEIHAKEVECWIVGHAHPAVRLEEKAKSELYKCFLDGDYKGRRVVIVPSFFSVNEGTDPREFDLELAWNFNLKNFYVRIVGEDLRVLDFGRLRKIP